MLVITRRVNESIIIDGHIRVTIVAHKGGKIRLGITAPDHVRVDREEIHDRRILETADTDVPELVACPHGFGPR